MSIANFAELKTALAACKGGETLELASGDMTTARLNMVRVFNPPVRIKGNGTRFVGMFQVEDINGLIFDGVEMKVDATADHHWCIRFYRCANVEFTRGGFEGTIVPATETTPEYLMGFGIMNLPPGSKITWCKFRNLSRACTMGGIGAIIEDNDVWRVSEGFQASNLKKVSFQRNCFSEFMPKPGDHPDAIQLHGSTSANSSQDIVVKDNLFSSIKGRGMQGFFVRNEYWHARQTDPTVPCHERITAEDNLVLDGWWNSIFIEDTKDTLIQRNRVYCFVDSTMNKKMIRIGSGTGVIKDNLSHSYSGTSGAGYVNTNNILGPMITRAQAQVMENEWLAKFRPIDLQVEIAALTAEVAGLKLIVVSKDAELAAANDNAAVVGAELAEVRAALATANDNTAVVTAALATNRDILAAIKAFVAAA